MGGIVREARKGDVEAVHALACELARTIGDDLPAFKDVEARFLELLEERRARVLVAESGGEMVGVASLWVKGDLAHGDTVIEVPMLAVRREYRRSGVGKELMAEVQRIALEKDAKVIELVTTRGNRAAKAFYRSLGFTEANVVPLELNIS
jgi:ribosomal protein S18 acetylase RimI-like enzyme